MDNQQNFNVAISNELLKEIDVGDEVTVKIDKGWAEDIVKLKKN